MQSYYRIALDDLLGRNLTVQWFEGVAIVQGVCRQLLADASSERGFPSLAGVYVCANGGIEVEGTASPSQSVAAAGHALTQMLGEDAPVRLRLVATQATAGESGYQSLQQFSDEVAYFERPDPEGILRALHSRAWDAELGGEIPQEIVQTVTPQEASTQAPTPAQQTSAQPKPEKKGHSKWLVPAGIAGSILCIALWRLPLGSHSTAATSVVATVQNAVRSTLARVAPAAEAQKADVKADTVVASSPPVKRGIRRLPLQNRGNTTESRTRPSGRTLPAATLSPLLPVGPLPSTTWSKPEVAGDVDGERSQTPAVYSALNAEVVPPKSVYPKLPAAPPSGFSVPGQTVLEMVIGTNGLVERVKLRTEPRNIHEFMLVSAAKAWQFEPARLHGIPVRYLHTVILTLQ